MSYVLTSLSGNLISAASAGYAPTNSADVSAIASAYVSGKQDTLTFAYDDDKISAINGSALAGGGGVTGDYVEKSAMEVAIGSGNAVSATSFAFGENNSATSRSFALGSYCAASASSIALGSGSRASSNSISVGYSGYSNNRSLSLGNRASANMNSIAAGAYSTASDNSLAVGNHAVASLESIAVGTYCRSLFGYARGQNNSGDFAFMDGTSLRAKSATAFGTCNLSGNNDSAVFVIGDGTDSATGRHDLMTISRDGEITMYSSTADTAGTGIMSSIRAISAAATGGGVDSATVSAIASSYVESGVSSKLDTSAFNSGDFYSTSNPSGFITGVDLTNYATTSYVDSSVSGKLDTTAFNSGDFYSTSNPSGFIDSAYVDSAVSGKADSSALSSYALSADVSGTVDLVSTQSANWGGSALALSAGPGISLTLSGNTLVASTDETVLWENYTFASNKSDSVVMSEDPFNFSYVRITFEMETTTETWPTVQTQIVDMVALSSCVNKDFTLNGTCVNESVIYARCSRCHFNGTAINDIASVQWYNGNVGTMAGPLHIYRIVGIDRIAGV